MESADTYYAISTNSQNQNCYELAKYPISIAATSKNKVRL